MLYDRTEKLEVVSVRTLGIAFAIHVAFFAGLWIFAVLHGLFDKEDEIVPIDLTVVVNENLDGVENEPPPLKNPEPEPPKPKLKPEPVKPKVKEPEKPKELERIVTNIVVKVDKKEAKKPEKTEPEKPKKTAKELREERMKKMRESATVVNKKTVKIVVNNAKESGNGRTERQTMTPDQIRKLLDQGYRPGTKTQLAPNVRTRCVMLIQRALDEKWDRMMPSVGASGTVNLSVQFNKNGGMMNVRLVKSCGDRTSDNAALSVARSVSYIQGLDAEFIAESLREPVTVVYRVQGR